LCTTFQKFWGTYFYEEGREGEGKEMKGWERAGMTPIFENVVMSVTGSHSMKLFLSTPTDSLLRQ